MRLILCFRATLILIFKFFGFGLVNGVTSKWSLRKNILSNVEILHKLYQIINKKHSNMVYNVQQEK